MATTIYKAKNWRKGLALEVRELEQGMEKLKSSRAAILSKMFPARTKVGFMRSRVQKNFTVAFVRDDDFDRRWSFPKGEVPLDIPRPDKDKWGRSRHPFSYDRIRWDRLTVLPD